MATLLSLQVIYLGKSALADGWAGGMGSTRPARRPSMCTRTSLCWAAGALDTAAYSQANSISLAQLSRQSTWNVKLFCRDTLRPRASSSSGPGVLLLT